MQYEICKKRLLENGFREATNVPGCFYREMMPYTAFAVNIRRQLVDEAALDVFVNFVVKRIAGYLGKD